MNGASKHDVAQWGVHAPILHSIGVDWITQVYPSAVEIERARYRVGLWQLDEQRAGNYARPWTVGGICGTQVGGVAFAASAHYGIAQVTGAQADHRWRDLSAIGGHSSRVDVQCTFQLGAGARCPARSGYELEAVAAGRGRRVTRRTLIVGSDGGATLYVGAPSSEHRLRVYDKGVEAKLEEPGRLYRWEVQLRRLHAEAAVRFLWRAPTAIEGQFSLLKHHCDRRSQPLPSVAGVTPVAPGLPTRSDSLASYSWLETAVRPSVQRLLRYYTRSEILEALGLADATGGSGEPLQGGSDNGRG